MRTILRVGYTNILLQEGVDTKDIVSAFDNAIIVSQSGKRWHDNKEDTVIEILSVLDKTIDRLEDDFMARGETPL
jgi:hypothetical protein